MYINFEVRKSIHLLLFVLQSLGGKAVAEKVFLMFYFADMLFLSRHGRLGFGSFYLAMKAGPAPYNILWLLIELGNKAEGNISARIRHYIDFTDNNEIKANVRYESDYLSAEEVECMFTIIQQYKRATIEEMETAARGLAWQNADHNSTINVLDMAREAGATDEHLADLALRYSRMVN